MSKSVKVGFQALLTKLNAALGIYAWNDRCFGGGIVSRDAADYGTYQAAASDEGGFLELSVSATWLYSGRLNDWSCRGFP